MAIDIIRLVLMPAGVDEETANDRQIIIDMKVDTETQVSTGRFPRGAASATSRRTRHSIRSR